MCDNIKQFLNQWRARSHKLPPIYNIVSQGGKGKQALRFNCEITVDGFNYIGFGSSTSKKDAQTNAALDFVNYLVKENVINQQIVPEFEYRELVGKVKNLDEISPLNKPTENLDSVETNKIECTNDIPDNLDQKDIKETKGVEFTVDIHGNWTIDNAKARLHQYMQYNKVQSDYRYIPVGPDHSKSFVCEMGIFCNQLKRTLYASETGSTKQTSSKACALSLVTQMFHLGVIEAFGGVKKKFEFEEIPLYSINVDPEIKKQLSEVVCNLGLKPKEKPELESSEEIDMIVDNTIVDFEPQNHHQPQVIPWSPVIPNWNAWSACNIDEGEEAFLSLEEISLRLKNKFTETRSNKALESILIERQNLPAADYEESIINAILENQIVLIRGETGSGKTTQVPQFIMDYYVQSNKGAECNVIVTQPHRISAITLAERVAQERGEQLGQTCGYSVRFETVHPQYYGGLLYCTVGTLLRKMESGLRGISHIIVDEIHERDLNTDFLMILLKDMAACYPQIKIILMGANIDVTVFTNFFPDVFSIKIEGRNFPVNYFFLEDCIEALNFKPNQKSQKDNKFRSIDVTKDSSIKNNETPDEFDVNSNMICDDSYKPETKLVMGKLSENEISFELIEALLLHIETIHPDGAVLIFLPGWNIIQLLLKILTKHAKFGSEKYKILPLHSQVSRVDLKKVFQPTQDIRKIILATNIAESSITINDVMFVIDSCRTKVKMFTSRNNLTSYNTVWASKENLEQRRSCAGRVSEGYAFHLCSRTRFERLETHQTPEILRSALHDVALMIKLLKLGDTKEFLSRAIEQPPIDAIIEAEHLLKEMKAFDKNDELTPLGKILARLPIEPRMGKMIIFGCLFGVGDACATVAACTSLGDPFIIPQGRKRLNKVQVDLSANRCSDHIAILNAFQKWSYVQSRGFSEEEFCASNGLNPSILKMSKDAASQMKNILINTGFPQECLESQFFDYDNNCTTLNNVLSLLVLGLYPNVCYHKEKRKVLTTEGKAALVHKSSVNCSNYITTFPSPFFIFGEKIRTREIYCKQMSMINPLQLLMFGARKVTYINKMIILDEWLSLDMEFEVAAEILALRPALEGLMVKVCMNPDIVMNPDDHYSQIMNIVTKFSDPVSFGRVSVPLINNPHTNRKRKNSHPNKPFNQNRGVPNKFRGFESKYTRDPVRFPSSQNSYEKRNNKTEHRGNFTPNRFSSSQNSYQNRNITNESRENFIPNRLPTSQKSYENRNIRNDSRENFTPNRNSYSRPFNSQNFHSNIPFVEKPNSSFIRNQFIGNDNSFNSESYANEDFDDSYHNRTNNFLSSSGYSNSSFDSRYQGNSFDSNHGNMQSYRSGMMYDNMDTQPQTSTPLINNHRPFLTGRIPSFNVIAQYNRQHIHEPEPPKTYEMYEYQSDINWRHRKFNYHVNSFHAIRFRSKDLNSNPCDIYDNTNALRFNYRQTGRGRMNTEINDNIADPVGAIPADESSNININIRGQPRFQKDSRNFRGSSFSRSL